MLSSRLPALAQLVVTAMLFSGVFCPISTSAQTAWNICLAETGMRKVQACDKYINENSSNNKYGFYYRGVGWEESGNFVNALTDYKRYAQLSPSDYYATAAIERVTAALASAKAASAKSAWDICLAETGIRKVQACDKYINENSSNNKYGFYYRGVGWEESGNFVNALTDYKRYAQLSPSDYYATAAIERVAAALKTAAQSQAIQVPQQQQAAIQPQAQIPANLREGQRVALLIGNSKYQHKGLLFNPLVSQRRWHLL